MMKYWSVFRCAAQTRFAYHRDILLRNIFFFILIYIFYRLWFVLNQSGILSERYSYVQLVWYVIITQSLIGAFATLKGIVDLEIQSGRIGVMLIRPYNYLLYHLCEFLGKTVVMLINNFLIGVVFGWVVVGTPPLSFVQVVLFVPVCLLSLLLYFFVEFLIALLAFWTENTPPFFWFYQKIVFFFGGLLIPIEYYPSILKLVSQYLHKIIHRLYRFTQINLCYL